MKLAKICLALVLIVCLAAGCNSRSKTGSSSNPAVSQPAASVPSVVEDMESGAEHLASRAEDEISEAWDDVTSRHEGSEDENFILTEEASRTDVSREEPASAVMSTDFTEIGALSTAKLGWGSGGPTDDHGRPSGATSYQLKYGKYGAYFIAPSSQSIYLTFDEGYENGFTPAILDTLKEKNVKAVFFITLDFATSEPELVQRMLDEGHVLGNHSCKHLSFPDMALQDAAEDIMKLHNYVKERYFYEMHLFRFPMGEFNEQTLALVQSLGYKSVFWSFAYKDYDVNNQPLTIEALDGMANKCHPGAVYLLHAVSKTNAEVLPEAIDRIRESGYSFAKWDW